MGRYDTCKYIYYNLSTTWLGVLQSLDVVANTHLHLIPKLVIHVGRLHFYTWVG